MPICVCGMFYKGRQNGASSSDDGMQPNDRVLSFTGKGIAVAT